MLEDNQVAIVGEWQAPCYENAWTLASIKIIFFSVSITDCCGGLLNVSFFFFSSPSFSLYLFSMAWQVGTSPEILTPTAPKKNNNALNQISTWEIDGDGVNILIAPVVFLKNEVVTPWILAVSFRATGGCRIWKFKRTCSNSSKLQRYFTEWKFDKIICWIFQGLKILRGT